jgi:hypothetical protein
VTGTGQAQSPLLRANRTSRKLAITKFLPMTTKVKVDVIDYSKFAVAVKATSETEETLLGLHGMFNTRLKKDGETCPGWIFSAKRRAEVEKVAKGLNCKVVDYNPDRSIAIFPELEPHQKALLAVAQYNGMLKDRKGHRFGAWITSKKKQDQVVELVKTF